MSEANSGNSGAWERSVLEKVALAAVKEQRAKRRWGIFFRVLFAIYLGVVLYLSFGGKIAPSIEETGRHTALINIRGVIDASGENNADVINAALRDAFKAKGTAGVVLRINSPGGSPVQSGIVYDEITRLRKLHPKIPLYVVVEDLCASGGYYIASAADKIYVDKASIVGSIGVLMDGFGFVNTMDKLGVERRLLTAGVNKGFMDPFSPQDERQTEYAKELLAQIHQQFIGVVRKGRGARLHETPDMFSGLMWTGEKSIELGLADGLGTVSSVARDLIKAERIVDYSRQENLADKLAKRLGAEAAQSFGAGVSSLSVTPSLR